MCGNFQKLCLYKHKQVLTLTQHIWDVTLHCCEKCLGVVMVSNNRSTSKNAIFLLQKSRVEVSGCVLLLIHTCSTFFFLRFNIQSSTVV